MSRDPRRILLTTDAVGGVWVYTLDLAGEIARRHAQVDIAILGPAPTPEQIREAEAAGATIHITGLPLDWTAPSAETLAAASHNLAALARRLGVCLVQLHTPALAAPARFPAPVLAVLEAAQSGLPLVLADIPSFRELWSDAAIFLPPKAPNLWATTLRDLHVSPKLCRHWGFKSQTRAARYTQKRCAAAMWNEYRALLAPAARASAA